MRWIVRALIVPAVGLGIALPLAGCNSTTNEESVAGTKGAVDSNPPKSQADYYNQQKARDAEKAKTNPTKRP
jgi:hypothetical protein